MNFLKTKKFLAVILITALLLGLVSCATKPSVSNPPEGTSTVQTPETPTQSDRTPTADEADTIPEYTPLLPQYQLDAHTDGFEMDATLAAGIRESENLPQDALLTKEALAEIESLYIWEQKILTLKGIEYLPNLEIFSTDVNNLTSIEEIVLLKKLRQFRIGSGFVKTLPNLGNMPALTELSITGNLISDIAPISGAESLTFVDLSGNRITSIAPLKDTHRLKALILNGNCITDYYTASDNKELISALEFSNHKYKDILALENRAKDIVSNVTNPEMTPLEKEYALYRYIIEHAEYSEEMRKDMPFGYYILTEGVGVCGDYAEALALLCRHAGLDMFCVSSDTHAWNIIRLEGKYYHVDALWDEENEKESPIYFNRSTEFIQSTPEHEHDLNRYPHADDMPFSEYAYLRENG